MIKLNLSAKKLDPTITYKPFKPVLIEQEEKVNFLTDRFIKEVMNESGNKQLKKIKKLKKILKISISILGATANMTTRAFATTTTSGVDIITPAIIMKWGLAIALISVSAGVALSMTMLIAAGVYRMFRKKKEADEWTSDILRGLVQVLIAVPTVYLLYFLAQMLFSHLSALHGIF